MSLRELLPLRPRLHDRCVPCRFRLRADAGKCSDKTDARDEPVDQNHERAHRQRRREFFPNRAPTTMPSEDALPLFAISRTHIVRSSLLSFDANTSMPRASPSDGHDVIQKPTGAQQLCDRVRPASACTKICGVSFPVRQKIHHSVSGTALITSSGSDRGLRTCRA